MLKNTDYITARELLAEKTKIMGKEPVALYHAFGRVLAEDLIALENVPSFDRSPYDGYALRSEDTKGASNDNPVTLRILEEIPAGAVPTGALTEGTAAKILTGAPIPEGADAVIMFEKTRYDNESVTVFAPMEKGENVVYAGEDVKKGSLLVKAGSRIDPGVMGTLAGQNVAFPKVRLRPQIGIISTGSELTELGDALTQGHIYNTNRYTLTGALESLGCDVLYFGIAGDSTEEIAEAFSNALSCCDAVVSTGGVSVGDYDLTPDAMVSIGAEILVRGVNMKPGMACCYGVKDGKLLLGLSGNPSASLTNFYVCCAPAIRKLCGESNIYSEEFSVKCSGQMKTRQFPSFNKGKIDFANTEFSVNVSPRQGNIMISSVVGCNAIVMVPGENDSDNKLKGIMI